jgi:hypothetical protein
MRPQDRGGTIDSQTRTRDGKLGVAVVGQGWLGRAIVPLRGVRSIMRIATATAVSQQIDPWRTAHPDCETRSVL